MVAAIQGAYNDRAYGDLFHRTENSGQLDDVVLVHTVFQLDEHPGNHVLNQFLGAKTNGQAGNPRAGNQGADIDTDLGQHDQHRHGGDDNRCGIAKQHEQGFLAFAGPMSGAGHAQAVLDDAGQHGPAQCGQGQDDGDPENQRDGGSPAGRFQPGSQVDGAPGIQHHQPHRDQKPQAPGFQRCRNVGINWGFKQG